LGTQAKQILADDDSLDHEYLPIAGLPTFTSASAKLIFGEDSPAIKEGLVSTYVASRAPCEEELEGCRC
jgi:aspartate aminotransferase